MCHVLFGGKDVRAQIIGISRPSSQKNGIGYEQDGAEPDSRRAGSDHGHLPGSQMSLLESVPEGSGIICRVGSAHRFEASTGGHSPPYTIRSPFWDRF